MLKPGHAAVLNRWAPIAPAEEGISIVGDEDEHDRYKGEMNYLNEMIEVATANKRPADVA